MAARGREAFRVALANDGGVGDPTVSDEIRGWHPSVDWRGIRGFRNIVVHGCIDVLDLELTWTFIERGVDSSRQVATSELGRSN